MVARFMQIDASDWQINDDKDPYPERAIRDACDRAVGWRQQSAATAGRTQQAIDAAISYEINHTLTANAQGWVRLGWVVEGIDRLAILWHPASDRIRVERPTKPTIITLPQSESPPVQSLVYGVIVRSRDERITLRLRPVEKNDGHAPALTVEIPLPEPDSKRDWFVRMMHFAEMSLHYTEVPVAFPTWSGHQRREWVIAYAQTLADRMARPKRKWRR